MTVRLLGSFSVYGAYCWESLDEYSLNIYESCTLVFEDEGTSLVF